MTTTTPTPKTPWYRAPWVWFWLLALLVFGVRIGYKMKRHDENSSAKTRMERLTARSKKLEEQIRASQAGNSGPVVVADSTLLADTTGAQH